VQIAAGGNPRYNNFPMKSLFAGYYRPTAEEFDELWKKCVFIFDASVLLDLYRSTAKTREVVLSILGKLKDRIWLPYQAAWEYQENRLDVIAKERALYSELRETLDGLVTSVQQKMHNHAVESAEKIKAELESATKKILAIIDQGANEHPDLLTSDHIRETISELFNSKVGQKLDEKRLANIYQDGSRRYEQKTPPGYKDAEKGGTRQFGDLVIWTEILEKAKAIKQPVVFVTSDTKEDWWWKHGQFTVGPRPELVQEMISLANVKFYMYNVERFLSEAQKRIDTKVELIEVERAADEFKEIESKKQIGGETSSDLATDLAYLWEQQSLLYPKQSQSPDFRGAFARFARRQQLDNKPASEAGKLSVEEWMQAIEDIENRVISSSEIAVLNKSIESGDIGKLVVTCKTLKDAVRAVSVFLFITEQLHSALHSSP
jgi:hypothetical protein